MIVALVGAAAVASEPLPTFEAIADALEAGAPVRAVVQLGTCLRAGEGGPDAVLGFAVDRFELVRKGAIGNPNGFLVVTHSVHAPHAGARGYAVVLTRLKLTDDGRAEVIVAEIDPKTHKRLTEDVYGCAVAVGTGVTLFGD